MNSGSPVYKEVLWDLLTSKFDSKSTKNEEYAEQLMEVQAQFVKRNAKLTELLDDYITQRKRELRQIIFLKSLYSGFLLHYLVF